MTNSTTLRSAVRALSSTRLASLLLLVLFVEVGVGTAIEARSGLWEARRLVFGNWLGGVPLVASLGALNLLLALALRLGRDRRRAGLWVAHAGILLLLGSGAANLALSSTAQLELGRGEESDAAVFSDRWEIADLQVRGAELETRAIPLESWTAGESVDLGGSAVRLLGRVGNGAAGMGGALSELPGTGRPEDEVPAASLRLEAEGATDFVLDRFHPERDLGGGRTLALRRARMPLPFRVRLDSFRREVHPGSTRPKAFESSLEIREGSASRKAVVRMNHPLRLGDFTLFQSSWKSEPSGAERSVLSVVRNPGSSLPYAACVLIGLGLLLHLVSRRPVRGARLAPLIALAALGAAAPARAADASAALGRIPIQVDGRVKTLETFAGHTLTEVSGRSRLEDRDALSWLSAMLFDPGRVEESPVVLVENPDVRDALGLSGRDRARHPWSRFRACGPRLEELARAAASKEASSREAFDREVLRLSDVWFRMRSLEQGLAFLRPGSVPAVPSGLPRAGSFLDVATDRAGFARILDSLERLDRSALRPADDSCLLWFRAAFSGVEAWDEALLPLSPVPGRPDIPWRTPSALIAARGLGEPEFRFQAMAWARLREAWMAGDLGRAESAAGALDSAVRAQAGPSLRPAALRAEAVYNAARPFDRAQWAFLLALGLSVPWLRRNGQGGDGWRIAATVLLGSGFLLCLAGSVLRAVVTLRPPVTNLHETFLFVASLSAPLLGGVSWRRSWAPGLPLGAAAGAAFLALARGFGADGDTMPVLVAVLDSNLWLSVHVLTITAGYAVVMAAGIAAHWQLWQSRRGRVENLDVVRLLLGWGLFLTFLGTLLGGVWADQSWGRFWGWDPKENGALMIALWCALVFHARHAGLVGERGFAVGAALSVDTVLFAWFGVNLLGVGLHSYGFTQGAVAGLAAWAAAEVAFLVWTVSVRKG